MKFKDVVDLPPAELKEKLNELNKQLIELELKRKSGAEKPHLFKATRRDIARVLTALNAGKTKR